MSFTLVLLPPQSSTLAAWAERLRADLPGIVVLEPSDEHQARSALARADAAFGVLPADWVPSAVSLRWLQAPLAQPPVSFYSPELVAHPVVVTNMRGTYTDHVAGHTVALLLALARGLWRYGQLQREHRWQRSDNPFDATPDHVLNLADATILLVGCGAVGAEFARLVEPFGARVVATDARVTQAPPGVAKLYPAAHLDGLLPEADAVVVTVPHSPETELMFDAERLARLKRGAFLVNVGRGSVVDTDALAGAIAAGGLRGAALDVVRDEPLDPGHPIWDLPGVIITPHVAADGPGKSERRYQVLRDNARRFASREPLMNVVDKAQWF